MSHVVEASQVSPEQRLDGPNSEEIQRELSRLATLQDFNTGVSIHRHTDEDVQYNDVVAQNISYRDNYHVVYGGPDRSAEFAKDPADAKEKVEVLYKIAGVIHEEAHKQSEPESVDWGRVADHLLTKAYRERGSDQHESLVVAAISAQFTHDPRQRFGFVQKVYEEGLQSEMSKACNASSLFLVLDEDAANRIHKVQRFAKAFEAEPEIIERYAKEVSAAAQDELPSDKRIQKEIIAGYEQGSHGDEALRAKAQEVSTATDKLNSTLIDLHKVERFALEQIFIKRQMEDVLRGLRNGNTALSQRLAERRQLSDVLVDENLASGATQNPDDPIEPSKILSAKISRLEVDVTKSFNDLSEGAKKEFSLEGVDLDAPETWTRSQAVAARFRDVIELLGQDISLGAFTDVETFVKEAESNLLPTLTSVGTSISSVAEDGAALPEAATSLVKNVMGAVLRDPQLHDATPEELRDFAHANRRSLLRLATHHIQEFTEVDPASDDVVVRRNEQGKLEMLNAPRAPAKGSLDFYSAILLGCPALRLQHEDRPAMSLAERVANGSSNYIDHATAAVINEAYERGLFDLKTFSKKVSDVRPTSVLAQTYL